MRKINPKDDRVYYNIGLVYAKQKNLDKMMEIWQKAFDLNPKSFNWIRRFILLWYKVN